MVENLNTKKAFMSTFNASFKYKLTFVNSQHICRSFCALVYKINQTKVWFGELISASLRLKCHSTPKHEC